MNVKELEKIAREVKKDILHMSLFNKAGHISSALSMSDYLTVLFNSFFDFSKDKLIIGKPYGSQAYYSIFKRLGLTEEDPSEEFGGSKKNLTYGITHDHPLVDFADDTLGNSLSVACGIALASRNVKVFVNISDAALQAGTVWEAIMFASTNKLNNLILLIDNNNLQCLGNTSDIVSVEPISKRLESFGWDVYLTEGNNLSSVIYNLNSSKVKNEIPSKPTAFIFKTTKGSGISFMENKKEWHYRTLTSEEFNLALMELEQ